MARGSTAGTRRGSDRFSLEAMVAAYERLYEEAISS